MTILNRSFVATIASQDDNSNDRSSPGGDASLRDAAGCCAIAIVATTAHQDDNKLQTLAIYQPIKTK